MSNDLNAGVVVNINVDINDILTMMSDEEDIFAERTMNRVWSIIDRFFLPDDDDFEEKVIYRKSDDIMTNFIDDKCELDARASVSVRELYSRFCEYWAENMDDKVVSEDLFFCRMSKNFKSVIMSDKKERVFHGLRLLK